VNIILVTPYLPYPQDTGGKAAQFSMLKAYPRHYNIRLIYKAQTRKDTENAINLENQLENLKVLLCDPVSEVREEAQARENKDIGRQVLHFPARIAWKLLLVYQSLIDKIRPERKAATISGRALPQLTNLPVPVYHQLSASVLNAIQSNLDWADLIQADFVDLLHLSCLTLGSKPKIFVVHQVHTSYVETFFQSSDAKNEDRLLTEYHCKLTHLLESAFLEKYDAIIVFSQQDMNKIRSMGVKRPILVSPFTYPLDIKPVHPKSLAKEDWKRELVFIGSGEHGPNEKGLEWFLDEVYSRLDKKENGLGKPPLNVIGSWSVEQQQKLQVEGVYFLGFVSDLSEAIKGRACICPIQIGAGLRTKLLAAAISSSPIITTSLGCQGIGMEHEVHCLMADDPIDFANQISRLMEEINQLGPKLAANAYTLVETDFSLDTVARQRTEIFEALLKNRSISRVSRYEGQ
jgi:glycosyltransferase involved in cell wall biosynthesis